MTASGLKSRIEQSGAEQESFTRQTMKYFGDSME